MTNTSEKYERTQQGNLLRPASVNSDHQIEIVDIYDLESYSLPSDKMPMETNVLEEQVSWLCVRKVLGLN